VAYKVQSDLAGEYLEALAIEDHNMVVGRHLAEQTQHCAKLVNYIIPERCWRRHNHASAGSQRPRQSETQELEIENMFDHGAHHDGIERSVEIDRIIIKIKRLEFAVRMGPARLLDVAFGQVDANISVDAIRRMIAQLSLLAANIQDIPRDMGQNPGVTGTREIG
jgi:hypothetical protein